MPVAYFIRRLGDVCAVIKLHPDNREEVVQDHLSVIEAEILCAARMADIPRPASQQQRDTTGLEKTATPKQRTTRQFELKL